MTNEITDSDQMITPKLQTIIDAAMGDLDKRLAPLNIAERTIVATSVTTLAVGVTVGQLIKNRRHEADAMIEVLCEDMTESVKDTFEMIDTHMLA